MLHRVGMSYSRVVPQVDDGFVNGGDMADAPFCSGLSVFISPRSWQAAGLQGGGHNGVRYHNY